MDRKRILSGMRPTGPLHLGNLVGALSNWVEMQNSGEYDCFYFIPDWHALMSDYKDPSHLRENSVVVAADYIACGLDPEKSTIFIQSQVPEHIELNMILSALTPVSWLERCPTYKEQVQQLADKDVANYGFLGYPVLQAADIILYRAHLVPVGEDQLPHLELAREITRRFNTLYKPVFPEPQAKLTRFARLAGIDNRKMSKSYGNHIELGEKPESIREKVGRMITDPKRVKKSDAGHPEECNVYAYWRTFAGDKADERAEECKKASVGCVQCKKELAERLIEFLDPIKKRREELLGDKGEIENILEKGRSKASKVACETMALVHEAMGF